MPVVNPGIRRYIGSAIQRLFNSASFSAPLTHSLTLERGTGSTTFTRATTATVTDNEGVLRTAIAGEARFTGARRVRNLLTNTGWTGGTSGTLGSGGVAPTGWTALGGTGSITFADSAVHSGSKSIRFQATAQRPYIQQSVAVEASSVYMLFVTVEAAATANLLSNLLAIATVPAGATSVYLKNGSVVDGPTTTASTGDVIGMRLTVSSTAGTPDWRVGLGSAGSPTGDVTLSGPQLENITGRTDQTTPSEYVSVGVLSAPYHGAGVDGVKYFDTDLSGNPIAASTLKGYLAEPAATNVLLHSNDLSNAAWSKPGPLAIAQNEIGVDGAISAWTLTDDNVGVDENINQASVKTAATWTDSCYFKKTTGAQATYPVFYAFDGATRVALCTVDTTNGVATVWTAYTGLTVQPSVARCRSFNDDKWFVELSFTATAATWTTTVDVAGTTNATQSTGTLNTALTGSCVVERLQSELGSSATSYIPTTTTAVARNADVESVPTSGNITASAGWIAITYTPTHAPSGTVFIWGTYVDASNYTAILHDATNLIFRKRISGVNYDATIANSFVSGTTYKMAATWGASGTGIALNGTLGTGHANTTAAQIGTAMQTGADGNGANQPGMSLGNERIGQRQLSSSELQAITR